MGEDYKKESLTNHKKAGWQGPFSSTWTHMYTHWEETRRSHCWCPFQKERAMDVIYLDLCKAFDTVPHNILLTKLERFGYEQWTFRWMRKWLDGLIQRAQCTDRDWWQVVSLRGS